MRAARGAGSDSARSGRRRAQERRDAVDYHTDTGTLGGRMRPPADQEAPAVGSDVEEPVVGAEAGHDPLAPNGEDIAAGLVGQSDDVRAAREEQLAGRARPVHALILAAAEA